MFPFYLDRAQWVKGEATRLDPWIIAANDFPRFSFAETIPTYLIKDRVSSNYMTVNFEKGNKQAMIADYHLIT